MVGTVASIPVTMESEQYKAMGRLGDEYRLQVLTSELVIDDPILKPLIRALVEHIDNLSKATRPVLTAMLGGGGAQVQLDALGGLHRPGEPNAESSRDRSTRNARGSDRVNLRECAKERVHPVTRFVAVWGPVRARSRACRGISDGFDSRKISLSAGSSRVKVREELFPLIWWRNPASPRAVEGGTGRRPHARRRTARPPAKPATLTQ
jgi:hypothetical protein